MSADEEDPYAVSSDSEDEKKGPPPKIAIERETELTMSQIKESLAQDEHKAVKDERTLEEIEALRQTKAAAVKRDFEEGTISTAEGSLVKEEVHGLDRSTLGQFKSKFENMADTLQQNIEEKMQAGVAKDELDEIKSQVSEVKQKWRTGELEGAEVLDQSAAREELEALKGGNVKERFQPGGQGDVLKSYDRAELDTSGAADARKSFIEGSAFGAREVERAAAGELSELKFTAMNSFKDKFEKGLCDAEDIERAKVELDLQLKELRKTFEKPESEMSPEERTEKKKAEIEAEFARYKLARKLQAKKAKEEGGAVEEAGAQDTGEAAMAAAEGEFDVKNLMSKFLNIDLTPKERAGKLEELEALRVEAKNLSKKFEQTNLDSVEVSEEKRRQLEQEFQQMKEERDKARKELEVEMAESAAQGGEKEDIQVAADHASKMAAKWEKIHAKEAKKAEKGKMPAAKN